MYRSSYSVILIFSFLLFSVFLPTGTQARSWDVSPAGPLDIRPLPPVPPELYLDLNPKLKEPSGNNALDAEETAVITVTISNRGKGKAHGVIVRVTQSEGCAGLVYERSLDAGDIEPGESIKKDIRISADKKVMGGWVSFSIQAAERHGFDSDRQPLRFEVIPFRAPKINFETKIKDDNGNSLIGQAEPVHLIVSLHNKDTRPLRKVKCNLQFGPNVLLEGYSKQSFDLGDLEAGDSKDIGFSFFTNKRIALGDDIPIKLNITTEWPSYSLEENLGLKIEEAAFLREPVDYPPTEEGPGKVTEPPASPPIAVGRRAGSAPAMAIVIGNKNYRHAPEVEFAHHDASSIIQYLTHTLAYKREDIRVFSDATKAELESIFGTSDNPRGLLYTWSEESIAREFFIYYSGHGAPDLATNDAYLLPVDADPDLLSLTGYSLATLYSNLTHSRAETLIIFIDACFSGMTEEGPIARGSAYVSVELKRGTTPLLKKKQVLILTATQPNQVAYWYREQRHSLFTYCLLQALQGYADKDGDRHLTADELKRYVTSEVRSIAARLGKKQEPSIQDSLGKDHVLVIYEDDHKH